MWSVTFLLKLRNILSFNHNYLFWLLITGISRTFSPQQTAECLSKCQLLEALGTPALKGGKISGNTIYLCPRLGRKCTSLHFFALPCTSLHSHALPIGSAFYPCTPKWECIIFFIFMHSQNQFSKIPDFQDFFYWSFWFWAPGSLEVCLHFRQGRDGCAR